MTLEKSPGALAADRPTQHGAHYKWVILAIGVAAQASFAAAFAGLPVTAVVMRSAYGMTTAHLGLVLGCMALGVTFSEMIWGLLTDRFGDRKVLLTGLLSTSVALLALARFAVPSPMHTPSYLLLGAGLILVGVLGGSVNSSSGRAIMGWFSDGRRGLAMSIRQTAIPAGGAVGALLLPWMAQRFGFQAVFTTLAAFCCVSALATWIWLHEHAAPHTLGPGAEVQPVTPSPLYRLDVWRLALASGLLTAPQLAVLTFGGVFLHDHNAASLGMIASVIVVVQVSGSVARIMIGRRSDRGGDRLALVRRIGLLAAAMTAGVALLADANTVIVAVLVCASGLAASAWHGVAYTEMAVMAGPARAGTALGMIGMTIFASAFITPMIIPLLLGASSWSVTWWVIAGAALLAVPITPMRASTRQ